MAREESARVRAGRSAVDGHDDASTPFDQGDDPGQLAVSLQTLYAMLLDDEELEDTLRRVAQLAAATLPTCDVADVTLIREGQPMTKGATDERARAVDAAQYASGAGPCLDAWRHGRISHLPSIRTDTRWPQFNQAADAVGILSTLAVPLQVRGEVIGALNLHSFREHSFSDSDDQIAQLFAGQAAVALANAQTHAAAVSLAAQLHDALESRGTIEQAKGILVAQQHCSPDDAFELLVQRSQHENRKLRLVADDIVRDAQQTT
jgi:GAF domain-containing protein